MGVVDGLALVEDDVARCAALHNYIVQYGWLVGSRSLDDLPRTTYRDSYREELEADAHCVDPSLQE